MTHLTHRALTRMNNNLEASNSLTAALNSLDSHQPIIQDLERDTACSMAANEASQTKLKRVYSEPEKRNFYSSRKHIRATFEGAVIGDLERAKQVIETMLNEAKEAQAITEQERLTWVKARNIYNDNKTFCKNEGITTFKQFLDLILKGINPNDSTKI